MMKMNSVRFLSQQFTVEKEIIFSEWGYHDTQSGP
jgi:hypothetical protein